MNARTRFWLAALILGLLMTGPFLLAVLVLALDLKADDRATIVALLQPHLPLGTVLTIAGFAGGMAILHRLFQHYVKGLARMAEQLRLMQLANRDFRIPLDGPPEVRALAHSANALAEQRNALLDDVDHRITQARTSTENERNRLMTLMSQLFVGIVVCNRDGRIVLYNRRAPLLLHGLPGLAGEVHFGLGRAIGDLLHPGMVGHACDGLRARIAAGATDPSARFVTASRSGLPLDVRLAPVLTHDHDSADGTATPGRIDGFVYTLDTLDDLPTGTRQWLAADVLALARRRLESRLGWHLQFEPEAGTQWVSTDAEALLDSFIHIARQLSEIHDVEGFHLGLRRPAGDAALALTWSETPLSSETVHGMLFDAVATTAPGLDGHALRDLLARAGAEFGYLRHAGRQAWTILLRLPTLPTADDVSASHPPLADGLHPDFDFGLFDMELDANDGALDRPLVCLSGTVFDTETSGLNPAEDAIIQIGAVRLLNQRLLVQETFNRLVDPERALTPENIAIHGIENARLQGCPTIANVLPAFHRFCADTVLIGHNVAFDLQFLKAQEARCGLAFNQPVLDTLLLSAVIHPDQLGHGLEDIAERLGVTLGERHDALADARMTGEIFLRMLPLLADLGITTLRQALEASERTPFARLKY